MSLVKFGKKSFDPVIFNEIFGVNFQKEIAIFHIKKISWFCMGRKSDWEKRY